MAKRTIDSNETIPQTSAPNSQRTFVQEPRLDFWKPRTNKEGAAAIFEAAPSKQAIFLKMLPQNKNGDGPEFDSKSALNVKLGRTDVGELLSVVYGMVDGLGKKNDKGYYSGIYHERDKENNSVIKLARGDHGFFLSLSVMRSGQRSELSIGITLGEIALLRNFLEKHVEMFYINPQ